MNKKNRVLIVSSVVLVILLATLISDYNKGKALVEDEASNYHIRISEQISEVSIIQKDMLSAGGNVYVFNLFHYISHYLLLFFGGYLFYILPILMGVISTQLVLLIFDKLNINKNVSLITSVLFILTPAFFNMFTTFKPLIFAVPLVLFSLFLLIKQKLAPGIILMAIIPLFGLKGTILAILLLIAIIPFIKELGTNVFWKGKYWIGITIMLFVGVLSYGFVVLKLGLPNNAFFEISGINTFFSESGGFYGIQLIMTFLVFLGVVETWNQKRKYYPMYLTLTACIALIILYSEQFLIYISLFTAFFSAYGITSLFSTKRKWGFNVLKQTTMLMIAITLIVSTAFAVLQGEEEDLECLEKLEDMPQGTVLSDFSNGFLIERYSKRAYTDENYYYVKDWNYRLNVTKRVFSSRNLVETVDILKNESIDYILVDKEMKQNRWNSTDDGLLGLLENSETFKKVCGNLDIEIWSFNKDVNLTKISR